MADFKPPAKRQPAPPAVIRNVGSAADLPTGNHWLGFEANVLARNTRVVGRSADYLDARRRQSDSYTELIDARMRIARKLAELADLHNVIAEDQSAREYSRWQAQQARQAGHAQAAHDAEVASVRSQVELTRLQEINVRAQRNLEAAQRVKEAEIDRWYAEAQSATNNARAEFQDTVADLKAAASQGNEPATPGAASRQREHDLSVLDHQIEIEKQRGNEQAVLVLQNLRARLRAAHD